MAHDQTAEGIGHRQDFDDRQASEIARMSAVLAAFGMEKRERFGRRRASKFPPGTVVEDHRREQCRRFARFREEAPRS